MAKEEGDWDLCMELARFLMALDETGDTLREALEFVNLMSPHEERGNNSFMFENSSLRVPHRGKYIAGSASGESGSEDGRSSSGRGSPLSPGTASPGDYFSSGLGR